MDIACTYDLLILLTWARLYWYAHVLVYRYAKQARALESKIQAH